MEAVLHRFGGYLQESDASSEYVLVDATEKLLPEELHELRLARAGKKAAQAAIDSLASDGIDINDEFLSSRITEILKEHILTESPKP